MEKTTFILFTIGILAGLLANLAILPTLPGFLAEGATPPTDVSEVAAASDQLKIAAAALLFTVLVLERAPPTTAARIWMCACAAVGITVYRAWDVLAIVFAWAGHVGGEHAVDYWFGVAVMATIIVLAFISLIVTY